MTHARTRIKICGLTRQADVEAAIEAGAHALGFVLYERSPRYVDVARCAQLARRLPPFVTPVCLLVNAGDDLLRRVVDAVPAALLQFHGDETPADCERAHRPYLRAARMRPGFGLLDFARQYANAAGLILDAHVEGYGGGGKAFDWSLIEPSVPLPLVLSGGLSPASVIDAVMHVRPWAVDVSSGVEVSPGVKDAELMRRFCDGVREADARVADASSN